MYDDLVKRLRCLKYGSCPSCPMWYSEEVEPNLWRERCSAIDAADAIEGLICEVADEHNARLDAEERRRWIPVTERLPEKHKWVLVVGDNLYDMDFISSRGDWTIHTDPFVFVKYWMPVPEAPLEERE